MVTKRSDGELKILTGFGLTSANEHSIASPGVSTRTGNYSNRNLT
jgi:hypothetical protein